MNEPLPRIPDRAGAALFCVCHNRHMSLEQELKFAQDAARGAGELALDYRRRGVIAEDKPDDSPVTDADKACERLVVSLIEKTFPSDGILGEEGASKAGSSGRRWIIDPIDGTRDFLRGNRMFCHLLALEAGGESVAGVAYFPALGEMYWATKGGGAFLNGVPLRVSSITDVSRSVGFFNSLNNAWKRPLAEKLLPFMGKFWAVRSFGGALDAMLVCAGHAEFWLEPSVKPWDLAAIRILGIESGARFFDYTGADTIYGGNAVMCVPALEALARELLGLAPHS